MATIRATCADCGDVEITSDDVVVRVCVDNGHGAYTFRCPGCAHGGGQGGRAPDRRAAIASGVRLHRWRLPAELEEQRAGAPIDHDDLLDFHRLLGDDGRLTTELGRLVEG